MDRHPAYILPLASAVRRVDIASSQTVSSCICQITSSATSLPVHNDFLSGGKKALGYNKNLTKTRIFSRKFNFVLDRNVRPFLVTSVLRTREPETVPTPFPPMRQDDAIQSLMSGIPSALRTPVISCFVGATLIGGAAILGIPPKSLNFVRLGAAVALAAFGLFGGHQMLQKKKKLALVAVQQALSGKGVRGINATTLDLISKEYGVNVRKEFSRELSEFYGQYLEHCCLWNEDLSRKEVADLIHLRSAFGLSADDLADVQVRVARALFRSLEERAGNPRRKTVGKLLYFARQTLHEDGDSYVRYVWSTIKDTFSTSDAQIQKIYKEATGGEYRSKIEALLTKAADSSMSHTFDAASARLSLEQAQEDLFLSPEEASEIFNEVAKDVGKSCIDKASSYLNDLEKRNLLNEIDNLLRFDQLLSSIVPGGMVDDPLKECAGSGNRRVMEIYRAYLQFCLREKRIDPKSKSDLKKLENMLGIPPVSAANTFAEIAGRMFRETAEMALRRGKLGEDTSSQLLALKEDLNLPEATVRTTLLDLYRGRYKAALKDEILREKDVEKLDQIKTCFKILDKDSEEVSRELAGEVYRKSAKNVVCAPVIPEEARAQLDQLRQDVRLSEDAAKVIFAEEVKKRMAAYVEKASNLQKSNPKGMAEVVNGLVEYRYDNGLEEISNVRTQSNGGLLLDVYRTYLLYALSPEVIELPMNTHVTIGRHEYEIRNLGKVGSTFGLAETEVNKIHTELSSKVFQDRVDSMLAQGKMMDQDRVAELQALRQQLALPEEEAKKIIEDKLRTWVENRRDDIRNKTTNSLDDIRQLRDMGQDPKSVLRLSSRQQIYRDEVKSLVQSEQATAEDKTKLEAIRTECELTEAEALEIEQQLARESAKAHLLNAVASVRQGNRAAVAQQLESLIRFHDFFPHDIDWERRGELRQLYMSYWKLTHADTKPTPKQDQIISKLQKIFRFSDEDVLDLQF